MKAGQRQSPLFPRSRARHATQRSPNKAHPVHFLAENIPGGCGGQRPPLPDTDARAASRVPRGGRRIPDPQFANLGGGCRNISLKIPGVSTDSGFTLTRGEAAGPVIE